MLGRLIRLTGRGLADFGTHPWAHLLSLTAVAMVTLMAGFILLAMHNVNEQLLKSAGEVEFQIYWKTDAVPVEIGNQWEELRKMKFLTKMRTYAPEDALNELSFVLGDKSVPDWLKNDNPLPYSALVTFAVPPDKQTSGWASSILTKLKKMDGVADVRYTPLESDFAKSWTTVARMVAWPVVGFLGLVLGLVVGNTIRLSLLTRMDEIEILSLVGARPWYIRWPLLTGGLTQGIVGSAMGIVLLRLVQTQLEHALDFPPLSIVISFLPMTYMVGLGLAVTFVALLSSWVAVR